MTIQCQKAFSSDLRKAENLERFQGLRPYIIEESGEMLVCIILLPVDELISKLEILKALSYQP